MKLKTMLKTTVTYGLPTALGILLTACANTGTTASSGNNPSMSTQYANSSKKVSRPSYHFADTRPATGKNVFIFDPKQYAWAAYSPEGKLLKTGYAAGGASYCSDIKSPCRTPVGTFSVHREGGPNCKSSKFPIGKGGAPMPHCAFFKGGYAVHGSYDVPPANVSHGCIRVTPSAARWLDSNVLDPGSTVIVKPY